MGQILRKLRGSSRQCRDEKIQKITDKVFDRFTKETGTEKLTFEHLYIAVLLVYNDMNKRLAGPHFDPPSREQIRTMMQESDIDLNGELDREEFRKFIQQLTKETLIVLSQGLFITLAVAPTIAVLTKRSTEGFPLVGKVIRKVPTSVYASLVTLAIVLFQNAREKNKRIY